MGLPPGMAAQVETRPARARSAIPPSRRPSAPRWPRRCAWPTCGSSRSPRCPPASGRPPPGTATSGSTTPSTSGASCATRSPSGWSPRWATWCREEMRAQLGPMNSMVAVAGRRAVRRPARQGARLARRRGALRRRHRPAARPGRHGRAGPGQHRGVRRGPGAPRRPGPPLRGPARGGPPAALRARAVAARARLRRGRDVRGGHPGQPGGDRGGDGPVRPDRPGVHAGDGPRGHLHARGHPAAEGRAGPAGDRARADRGLGLPRGRPGRRRPAARRRPRSPRRSAAGGPPAARPSRRSPRWSAWSCARAGCARPPRCGRRSPSTGVSSAGTRCGATPTCCPTRTRSPTRRTFARSQLDLTDLENELGDDAPPEDRPAVTGRSVQDRRRRAAPGSSPSPPGPGRAWPGRRAAQAVPPRRDRHHGLRGALRLSSSGTADSRSTSGSQSGTGSRARHPEQPAPGGRGDRRHPAGQRPHSLPISMPGRSGASATITAPSSYPSSAAA